jgi:hypothetical protein
MRLTPRTGTSDPGLCSPDSNGVHNLINFCGTAAPGNTRSRACSTSTSNVDYPSTKMQVSIRWYDFMRTSMMELHICPASCINFVGSTSTIEDLRALSADLAILSSTLTLSRDTTCMLAAGLFSQCSAKCCSKRCAASASGTSCEESNDGGPAWRTVKSSSPRSTPPLMKTARLGLSLWSRDEVATQHNITGPV